MWLFANLYQPIITDVALFSFSNGGNKPTNGGSDANPFDEEEWDEDGGGEGALIDTGEPGVKVKALYDYVSQEADELDFKIGRGRSTFLYVLIGARVH